MPKINVLPQSIAQLIAAGEVVERPASVIKELVENSVDAGATSITVEIKNGGITFMRITDNGCGIAREDVPVAFISHATSKLKTAEDLERIFTLGFRGEALASVASVARVEMMTRPADEEIGTRYCIEGGNEVLCDDAGCPLGTTIVVRDLFFNTPARMKFLKKDVTEANAVAAVVDVLALSNPQISFRFIRDGKQVLITSGDGKPESAVRSVLGKEISENFLPVNYELDGVKVSGFASKPSASRATRSMQFFFLNGRFVKSRTAVAALEEAYKGTVMVGKFPACVINISVEAHTVDVNVHPAKTEVRFSDERKIFSSVYYAVKSAVTNFDQRPRADLTKTTPALPKKHEGVQMKMAQKATDFWQNLSSAQFNAQSGETVNPAPHMQADKAPDMPRKEEKTPYTDVPQSVFSKPEPVKFEQPRASLFGGVSNGDAAVQHYESPIVQEEKTQTSAHENGFNSKPQPDAAKADEGNAPQNVAVQDETADSAAAQQTAEVSFVEEDTLPLDFRVIGEAFKTYIIVQQGDSLVFIDKHAAHERMIYEKLKNKVDSSTQLLMTPAAVRLGKDEYSAVLQNLELLEKAGWVVDDFGGSSVIVRECPMYIEYDEIEQLMGELAGYLVSGRASLETEKLDWLLHNSACRAAVKAGNKTSMQELESFARTVFTDGSIRYCPHGRPVSFELTRKELEKQFGRIN